MASRTLTQSARLVVLAAVAAGRSSPGNSGSGRPTSAGPPSEHIRVGRVAAQLRAAGDDESEAQSGFVMSIFYVLGDAAKAVGHAVEGTVESVGDRASDVGGWFGDLFKGNLDEQAVPPIGAGQADHGEQGRAGLARRRRPSRRTGRAARTGQRPRPAADVGHGISWTGGGADAAQARIKPLADVSQAASHMFTANSQNASDLAYGFDQLKAALRPMPRLRRTGRSWTRHGSGGPPTPKRKSTNTTRSRNRISTSTTPTRTPRSPRAKARRSATGSYGTSATATSTSAHSRKSPPTAANGGEAASLFKTSVMVGRHASSQPGVFLPAQARHATPSGGSPARAGPS
ncbi:predicted protein [Streptomyces sp. AA4]|nr:predicted protein [Streptomyces sp. AA4]